MNLAVKMQNDSDASLYFRKLNFNDFEAVCALYRNTSNWMGVKVDVSLVDKLLISNLHEYLGSKTNQVSYGAFYKDKLILTVGVYYWSTMPFCSINRFVGGIDSLSLKHQFEAVKNLIDMAISEMEERQAYRFYVISTGLHQKSLSLFCKISEKIKNRYIMTIDEFVPANQKPKFGYVWEMMDKQTWPMNLVLRSGTALNKVRNERAEEEVQLIIKGWD